MKIYNGVRITAGNRSMIGCNYGVSKLRIPEVFTDRNGDKYFMGSIGYSAFERCYTLKDVDIPDGITDIDDYGFNKCERLSAITIPNTVVRIGENAFDECDSLALIRYTGTREQWCSIKIEGGNDAIHESVVIFNYIRSFDDKEVEQKEVAENNA